jgi:hypothetical protein
MSEKREQPKYVRGASLNEVERKMEVDRLNFENALLMHRIKTVPPVISVASFEKDFARHLHAESVLRRKMPKPNALPKVRCCAVLLYCAVRFGCVTSSVSLFCAPKGQKHLRGY